MAKADFCFTYYDGDAARDKAHMSRLERGAYDDIVSAQRKFGHLTVDLIKKILSKDFEECWPSIEIILKKDEAGKYFIEWLEMSIQKSAAHSKKQKENIASRYKNDSGNTKDEIGTTKNDSGNDLVEPLEDGNVNGYVNDFEKEKGVTGEKTISIEMKFLWLTKKPQYPIDDQKDLPALKNISDFIKTQMRKEKNKGDPHFGNKVTDEEILQLWDVLAEVILADKFWKDKPLNSIQNHLQEFWNKAISNANNTGKKFDKDGNEILTGRITKNAAAELLAAARLHHARKENAYGNTG